ncbi:MAG: Gfo/Idh/MocA family oxidoreductase [Candidatus Omnitrophica bacterium]|nr:Gfo/Idh/MocA family oxidoreductase [Candidatus Omnitrophota bacterium]
MSQKMNRRSALKKSAAAGAAFAAPLYVSNTVFGANDAPVMGLIGSGGRGRGVMGMHQRHDIKFAAISDVSEPKIAAGLKEAKRNNDGEVQVYKDFNKLLERKDIDAVVIGTPEHQHCRQMVAAVQAGKDVYCEKPMSHTIEEGAWAVQEVRKTDRIVQIGMQRRSAPLIHEGLKVIQTGILGDVNFVKAQWNWHSSGPQNNSPLGYEVDWDRFQWPHTDIQFEPKFVRNWRVFWPFSGGISNDQGTHIMDVVQWYMGQVTPLEADGFGFIKNYIGADAPDIFTTTLRYKKFVAHWTINYTSNFLDWWHILFQGEKGTMHLHRFGFQVYLDEDKPNNQDMPGKAHIDFKGDLPSQPHVDNFVECMKTRKEPNAPVEIGHTAVCGPHLGNLAYRNNCRAKLNEEATKSSLA